MKYINEIKQLDGKRILIRVDFNVPLDQHLNITDDNRIRTALSTINYALDEQAKVIIASHMGRPQGKVNPKLSMAPVAKRLSRLLQKNVKLAPDCIGPIVQRMINKLNPGEVIILENLRFHPGETFNNELFSKELASLCDIYVNDAFAVAHRENASVDSITKFASISVAGFTMKKELEFFHRSFKDPARPLAVVIGGAKTVTKLAALENLLEHANKILIGGAMANTFLMSVGYDVGKSLYEEELIPIANILLRNAKRKGVKLYLPVDCVVADRSSPTAETKIVTVQDVPSEWIIMDIGPATSLFYREALTDCKTIIWNGPMGAFEIDAFSRGTYNMVSTIAQSYALTIIGGGDTDVAVSNAGESQNMSYISTGGGAFLALLTGEKLPAITALEKE